MRSESWNVFFGVHKQKHNVIVQRRNVSHSRRGSQLTSDESGTRIPSCFAPSENKGGLLAPDSPDMIRVIGEGVGLANSSADLRKYNESESGTATIC